MSLDNLRFRLALFAAKVAYGLIKLTNKTSGTSIIGVLTLKICPNFLSFAKKYVKEEKIAITGTNGKTTTASILSTILKHGNKNIVHNEKGANMLSGVANAFALSLLDSKDFDNAVIESDEAYLADLFNYIEFDSLIVTNLFRDQLDRYGELEITAEKIKNGILKNKNIKLFLNADDPLVASLNNENTEYFGICDVKYFTPDTNSNAPSEVQNCHVCHSRLKYTKTFYSQLGHYYCECGYERKEPKYSAKVEVFEDSSTLKIFDYTFKVPLKGLYNAYNALSAISLALSMGYSNAKIQEALNAYKPIFGRSEFCKIKDKNALIQLIKNPTGASEVLKNVDKNSQILIAINDNYADGRDISWLWDSDFEQLKGAKHKIIVSGIRALDAGLRLKYAKIDENKVLVEPNLKKALDLALENKNSENLTILPSYTALLELVELLKRT